MANPLRMKSWSPYVAGAAIGLLSWFAFASANRPIGVTTAFEHAAALAEREAAPGSEAAQEYAEDKDAKGKPPKISWETMLVVGVFVGALVSSTLSGDRGAAPVPPLWKWRFGESRGVRYIASFLAGGLMMFGARLAQGCTSGHGISGTMQLAVSSWLFISVAFVVAMVVVWMMYGKEGARHV